MLKFLALASFVCISLQQQQNIAVTPNVVVVPTPPSSGITCTRTASAQINVDGIPSQVFCSIGPNSRDGCMGCCKAVGLTRGLTTDFSVGFPSSQNNQDCICCFGSFGQGK